MTVNSLLNKVQGLGNGSVGPYAITFPFELAADISVIVTDVVSGVDLPVQPTYSITGGAGDIGNVTFNTVIPTTQRYTFRRVVAATQLTSYPESSPFPAKSHEKALDKLTYAIQQLAEAQSRAITLSSTTTVATAPILADPVAGAFLGWDATGTNIINYLAASTALTPVTAYMATVLLSANAAAARTALGVVSPPFSNAQLNTMQAGTIKGNITRTSATPADVTMMQLGLHRDIGHRLTLTSGVPVTVADVTGTTLYLTPYKGSTIALFDGAATWNIFSMAQISIAIPAVTSTMYDVFVYDNAGTPTLELTAWTSVGTGGNSVRATALAKQDDVYVRSGATTRRYVGTILVGAVSGTATDTARQRYVWNYYNRTRRGQVVQQAGGWTYTAGTYRIAAGNAANILEMVIGVAEDSLEAKLQHCSSIGAVVNYLAGIGFNSATSPSSSCYIGFSGVNIILSAAPTLMAANYSAGYNYFSWLESSDGINNVTSYGDQSGGLRGSVMG